MYILILIRMVIKNAPLLIVYFGHTTVARITVQWINIAHRLPYSSEKTLRTCACLDFRQFYTDLKLQPGLLCPINTHTFQHLILHVCFVVFQKHPNMTLKKKPYVPVTGRKPIRPIERQKMRAWLLELLDSGRRIPGFEWASRREKTFKISWRHAARHGWDPSVDGSLFELWARHTGEWSNIAFIQAPDSDQFMAPPLTVDKANDRVYNICYGDTIT